MMIRMMMAAIAAIALSAPALGAQSKAPAPKPAATAAAVFRRAGYLWVVFDQPGRPDFSVIEASNPQVVAGLEQIPSTAGTVIRMAILPGVNPHVERDGLAWVLELRAAELRPDARFAYVFGVALHSAGKTDRALEVLRGAWDRHPGDHQLLVALVTIERDAGKLDEAKQHADALVALMPDDDGAKRLRAELDAPR